MLEMNTPMLPLRAPPTGNAAAVVGAGDRLPGRAVVAPLASATPGDIRLADRSGGEAGAVKPDAEGAALVAGAVEGRGARRQREAAAWRGETYISVETIGRSSPPFGASATEPSTAKGLLKAEVEAKERCEGGSGDEGGLGEGRSGECASRKSIRESLSSASSGALTRPGAGADCCKPDKSSLSSERPSIRSAEASSVELEPVGCGGRSWSLAELVALATEAIERFDTLCDESPRTDDRCELALRGRYRADERPERRPCRGAWEGCDGEKEGCAAGLGERCEGEYLAETANSIVLGVMGPSVSIVLERDTAGGIDDDVDDGELIVAFGRGKGAGGSRRTRVRAGASLASECSDMRRPWCGRRVLLAGRFAVEGRRLAPASGDARGGAVGPGEIVRSDLSWSWSAESDGRRSRRRDKPVVAVLVREVVRDSSGSTAAQTCTGRGARSTARELPLRSLYEICGGPTSSAGLLRTHVENCRGTHLARKRKRDAKDRALPRLADGPPMWPLSRYAYIEATSLDDVRRVIRRERETVRRERARLGVGGRRGRATM